MKPILLNTLTFIKKHLFALICGVVAIVAMVLTWYPAAGWYTQLQQNLDSRKQVAIKITQLLNKPRTLPLLNPTNTDPQPLKVFPRDAIIKEGTQVTQEVSQEANSMYETVSKLNEHKLLMPDSLPSPNRQQQYQFRDTYVAYVATNTLLKDTLKATLPPSGPEIDADRTNIWKTQFSSLVLLNSDGSPEPTTLAQQDQAFLTQTARHDLEMEVDRTHQYCVYVDPGFPVYSNDILNARDAPDPTTIWQAQMLNWVQTDIANAIVAADTDPTTHAPTYIVDSPIKRLVRVDLPPGGNMYVINGATPQSDPNQFQSALTPNYGISPTGRFSNGMYDVIHFTLTMDVSANQLPQLLVDMCRGQLLTVCRVGDIEPIDNNALANQGYMYGTTPMVRVSVDMEDLYLRDWCQKLMPDKIKTSLGIPLASAPAAGS